MKLHFTPQRNRALTRLDVLVLVLITVFLFAALMPGRHDGSKERAQRINCVSNLKQIGLSARIWEGDNNNKYPMAVSVTNGGGLELIAEGNIAGLFRTMSNELSTTKILICPADTDHVVASNFSNFNNSNISYFVNLDASEVYPQMIMLGDDNLATNGVPVGSGLLKITSTTPVSWTAARHKYCGNIAFADGSVSEQSNASMTNWAGAIGIAIP